MAEGKNTKKRTVSKSASNARQTAKKTNTPASKRRTAEQIQRRTQLGAILLFAVGLLITALTLIKGQNIWLFAHRFLFGMFGVPGFFIGPIMAVVAILTAKGKPPTGIKHKVWQIVLIFVLICSEIHIIGGNTISGDTLAEKFSVLYQNGTQLQGGGFAGGLIGMPLMAALGRPGAAVLVGILIFTFALILTGTTLLGFFRGIMKPVKSIENGYSQHKEERNESKQKFDIDIDLDNKASKKTRKKFFVPSTDILDEHEDAQQKEDNKNEIEKTIDDLIEKAAKTEKPKKSEIKDEALKVESEISGKMQEQNSSANEYRFPSLGLLNGQVKAINKNASDELRANAERLVDTMRSFGVETRIINICRGPSVTRYEVQPSAGVKISRITSLADDIALNLAAGGVRIEAPIPNKAAVGIEVPNKTTDIVSLKEIIESSQYQNLNMHLAFALGKDIAGNPMIADIGKMPHVLIAGSTGSGKSVCINSLIISLIFKSSPDDVRLLMIDPKVVELNIYNGIPHLLVPVVTDPRKAAGALGWAVTEMLNRYKLFADSGVRDINGYNKMARRSKETSPLPRIVIIIDELADLMMAASKEVEESICRLAQMARAAGMHLVIATQRPSVDVITGVIKANIPSRIAFAVSSQVDSRTILDGSGAEKLLGRGDMLFYPVGAAKPIRVQGCLVTDKEVERVVEFVKEQETAEYSEDIIEEIEKQAAIEKSGADSSGASEDEDPKLAESIECVIDAGQASTSFLQRRVKLGYARAARIMDEMENRGIVGPQDGSKPREILISKQQWLDMRDSEN